LGRKISDGLSVKVAVPQSTVIEQGKFVLLAGVLGMAIQSLTTGVGETGEVVLDIQPAEYETSQILTTDAFAAGDKVYWDAGNKRFTTSAAGNSFAGIVTLAKDANNVIWFWFAPQQTLITQAAAHADIATADLTEEATADLTAVATADLVAAAGANPTKAEYDLAVALVNELKAGHNLAVAMANALKGDVNAAVALVNELKGDVNDLLGELRDAKTIASA
jgi:predicted RecA/RadA family phage recombinase